jgi:hypothetical protein
MRLTCENATNMRPFCALRAQEVRVACIERDMRSERATGSDVWLLQLAKFWLVVRQHTEMRCRALGDHASDVLLTCWEASKLTCLLVLGRGAPRRVAGREAIGARTAYYVQPGR